MYLDSYNGVAFKWIEQSKEMKSISSRLIQTFLILYVTHINYMTLILTHCLRGNVKICFYTLVIVFITDTGKLIKKKMKGIIQVFEFLIACKQVTMHRTFIYINVLFISEKSPECDVLIFI